MTEFEYHFTLQLSESGFPQKKITNILKLFSYVSEEIKDKDIDLDTVHKLRLRTQMAEAGVEVTPDEFNDLLLVIKSIQDLIKEVG